MDLKLYKDPYFINEYNSFKTGYNSTLGGEGSLGKKQTDKNKRNMSLFITERNKKEGSRK